MKEEKKETKTKHLTEDARKRHKEILQQGKGQGGKHFPKDQQTEDPQINNGIGDDFARDGVNY